MTLQHLAGTGSAELLSQFAPVVDLNTPDDVAFGDVDITFCLTELSVDDVLKVLPPALHPSIPGMAGFMHMHVPGGPYGPFDLVLVGLLSRSGIKSRLLTTAAFVDGEAAAEPLSRIWGFPVRAAAIKLRINYDRVRSTVEIDNRLVLDFEVEHPISLTGAGGSVRYPQPFNVALRGNTMQFIQVDASYGFERVARGKPRISRCEPSLIGGLQVEHCFPVTGTVARAKAVFHPLRFVASTSVRAEDGGVSKIAS